MKAFQNLAKENNTLIIPADVNSISSAVAQAMTIYERISSPPQIKGNDKELTSS